MAVLHGGNRGVAVNPLRRIADYFMPPELPVLQEMPAHVRDLVLDAGLIMLSMETYRCRRNPDVNANPALTGVAKEPK